MGLIPHNGGPTLTHAIIGDSNALDAADGAFCPDTDQRGVIRPQGLACDIGAFEREYVQTPDEATEDLIEDIQDMVDSGELENGNGLIAKLENVSANLDKDNTNAVCNQLGAFINQVNGFIDAGKMSPEEGQNLIDSASSISIAIGC